MLNRFKSAAGPGLLLVVAGLLGACENGAGVDAGLTSRASVSFAATGTDGLFGRQPVENPITIGTHTIHVTRVELTLSELEFEGDSTETEIKGSTSVILLPVDGRLVTPVTARVAPGTYTELEMKVQSVRVQGTFDGESFDVSLVIDEDLEKELRPPIQVVENGEVNVTVALVVSNWFRADGGAALDPRVVTEAVKSKLKSNIKASFDAFHDDDRDCEEDED